MITRLGNGGYQGKPVNECQGDRKGTPLLYYHARCVRYDSIALALIPCQILLTRQPWHGTLISDRSV
ncbi:MAG: hypothetical protein ABI396_03815 [Ktedonobacteraceae bacterium]